jgi:hypothetical protein
MPDEMSLGRFDLAAAPAPPLFPVGMCFATVRHEL